MSAASQRRVFVAGATGVVGRRLVASLASAGHQVTAMTRRPFAGPFLRELGAEPVVADAFDAAAVRQAVEAARPDVVVHQLTDLAAVDTAANAALRIVGTRNLVDAALAAGVPRMVAQSIAWAYEPGDRPATEATPLDVGAEAPRDTTINGVVALEGAVRELPEWVILRYGTLYGPDTWFAPDGPRAADARGGRLVANADVTSFLHVDDAAGSAVSALAWPTGAVNVCDDEPAPASAWVPVYCKAVGAAAPPIDDAPRTPWARGASNLHARRDLDWMPAHPRWSFSLGG